MKLYLPLDSPLLIFRFHSLFFLFSPSRFLAVFSLSFSAGNESERRNEELRSSVRGSSAGDTWPESGETSSMKRDADHRLGS